MDQQDALVRAYARLSVHEMVLERMLANWLAAVPKEDADAFLDQFTDTFKMTDVAREAAVEDIDSHQILSDAGELGHYFVEKVRHLADVLREQ